ncbi:hypothetical protein [Actinokineospora sp. NPDC004072]
MGNGTGVLEGSAVASGVVDLSGLSVTELAVAVAVADGPLPALGDVAGARRSALAGVARVGLAEVRSRAVRARATVGEYHARGLRVPLSVWKRELFALFGGGGQRRYERAHDLAYSLLLQRAGR